MNDSFGTGADNHAAEYVTFVVDGQIFGLPILRVQDVFVPHRLTRVPLAPAEIAGVLNLRGRILTVIDMRSRLGLAARPEGAPAMAIGLEVAGESYALLVDSVGEVLKPAADTREPVPVNLDRRLAAVAAGIYRLAGQLLVVLDVDRILETGGRVMAA